MVVKQVKDEIKSGKVTRGFNAASREFEDLVKSGIIDPAKVVRTALQNAVSVAALLLTTGAAVTEAPETKKAAAPPTPGGEDYDF